jgi:hypothetical protein
LKIGTWRKLCGFGQECGPQVRPVSPNFSPAIYFRCATGCEFGAIVPIEALGTFAPDAPVIPARESFTAISR